MQKGVQKRKFFAVVGMAVLGGVLYFGVQAGLAQQTPQTATQSHIDCRPTKDYANSNGYVESYTRSNTCHSAKVFYNYGDHYENSTGQRVACPYGAVVYTHNSGGGWHYSMSPNISGDYDGPSHHWCVDASGNQVEAVLIDLTAPTFPSSSPGLTTSGISGTQITISWSAASDNVGVVGYNVYRNGNYAITVTTLSYTDTGLSSNTNYSYYIRAVDAAANVSAPSTTVNATTAAPTCTGVNVTLANNKTSYVQGELLNYTYTCYPAGTRAAVTAVQVVKSDGTATTYNSGTNIDTAALGFSTSNLAPGTYTLKVCLSATCEAASYSQSMTFYVTAGTSTGTSTTPTTANTPTLTGTIFKDGQYVTATGALLTCVSPNAWMKEGPTSTNARGFHCMPNYTPVSTDAPPANCIGTLWISSSTTNSGFSSDYCSTTAPTVGTTSPTTPPPPPPSPSSSRACGAGEKCPKGSWCQSGGLQCYYPDAQMACVPWSTSAVGAIATPMMSTARCPADTSSCPPVDPSNPWTANCTPPGRTVKYNPSSTASQPNCGGGTMPYYSKTQNADGTYDMRCFWNDEALDVTLTGCRPGDKNCKQKGDNWTADEEKQQTSGGQFYCTNSQRCSSASGGSCAGMNELCGAGTLYCPQNTPASTTGWKCGEPNTYTELTAGSGGSFSCGGGGQAFFVGTKGYCPPKKAGVQTAMMSAEDVRAVLQQLGPNAKLCNPFMNSTGSKCGEPGETITSNGWCVWNPPGSYMPPTTTGTTRTCPALDSSVLPPPASEISIGTLEPSSAPIGTQVTIRGTGFSPANNAVNFGSGYIPNLPSSSSGTIITFTVPQYLSMACAFSTPACLAPSIQTQPGQYNVTVKNAAGVTSNSASFTVTAGTGEKCGPGLMWCPAAAASSTYSDSSTSGYCAATCGYIPPGNKNWVKHSWTFSDGSTESSYILKRTDREYLDYVSSVEAQCKTISRSKFSWRMSAGDDNADNWKNFGIPDCSGSGVVPPPPQPRECNIGEMPGPSNMCMWPMYRWISADKKFEKCSFNSDPRIMGSAPYRNGTSCQSMNYELEVNWRTLRFIVHPPDKDGEWYMPKWDASSDRLKYNQKTDQLEACSAKDAPYMTGPMTADNWIGPCQPVPPEDKEWMLEMYRSQYKMFLIYSDRWKNTPVPPGKEVPPKPEPLPEPIVQPQPTDGAQCRPYLNGVRQGLIGDKQFWRDLNRKLTDVQSKYADAQKVGELLTKAKALIISIDQTAKKGTCAKAVVDQMRTDLDTLHNDIFSELSGHLTDMEDVGALAQCRIRLQGLSEEMNKMITNADSDETRASIKDFASRIAAKIKASDTAGGELGFDEGFACENFVDEMDSQLAPFRIKLNQDTNRVSQNVLEKLGMQVETLTKDLAEKEKKMDELVVQVAQLQQEVEKFSEKFSKVASEVSEKLVISYKALADMGDRFKGERQQILAEKNKLTSLVEEALSVMDETSCVKAAGRDQMARELGNVATFNWVPGRGEQLEKRLQLIISSCRARDFSREDMASFFSSLGDWERANLADSYRRGFTPFEDVATHEWFYKGMVNAYENGYMTKGIPAENALAQDALLMVLRAGGASAGDITGNCTLSAPGVRNVSPYAVCAVNYAHNKGLPLQENMTLPVERINIAEWITLLKPNLPKRADEAVDLSSFADIQSLGNDTRFVAYMYANGIMVGRTAPDGKTKYFDPHAPLTRAALAVILGQLQ